MKLQTKSAVLLAFAVTVLCGCNGGTSANPDTTDTTSLPPAGYEVVVDCGSSGTRAYLYHYDATNPTANISIVQQNIEKVDKPIASFASNPESAGDEVIKPLLDNVVTRLKQIDPNINLAEVEVFVGGTAGLRLIPEEQQSAIWSEVNKTIGAEGFTYHNATTIEGRDEGLYTWLDYNFIQDNRFESGVTEGTLEVGGASAQVAFATSSTGSNIRTYELLGKNYNIYSVSFLGFGVNQARVKLDLLASADSCYPTGYVSSTTPAFSGNFNYGNCNSDYTNVINNYQGNVNPSAIKSVDGFSNTQFAGIGNVWDTVKLGSNSPSQKDLKKSQRIKNNPISSSSLQSVIEEECARSLSQIETDFEEDSADAPTFCANAVFTRNFVFSSLGVQDEKIQGYNNLTNPAINPNADEDNEIKINWTLGYVLREHFVEAKN